MVGNGRANLGRKPDRRISNDSANVLDMSFAVHADSELKRDSAENSDRQSRSLAALLEGEGIAAARTTI